METKIMTEHLTRKILLLILCFGVINGKKHKLTLTNETRRTIDLSTFGYLQDGFLQFDVQDFTVGLKKPPPYGKLGFTVDKMKSSSVSSIESKDDKCLLSELSDYQNIDDISVLAFTIDFKENKVVLDRIGDDVQNMTVYSGLKEPFDIGVTNRKRRSLSDLTSDSFLLTQRRRKRDTIPDPAPTPEIQAKIPDNGKKTNDVQKEATGSGSKEPVPGGEDGETKPPTKSAPPSPTETPPPSKTAGVTSTHTTPAQTIPPLVKITDFLRLHGTEKYSFQVVILMKDKSQQGKYKLTFHNCLNTDSQSESERTEVSFTVMMIEKNGDNYLSAGHIPLPTIYFLLCVVFLGLACAWLYILKNSTEGVYKIHYLMLTLVYIKSLALLFHAINYHFLATQGHHEEAIAIIYYITYLMRGILLFVTIILIGAGWAFVKHILSDRDKKIFLIIIPLQILANVAQIFIEETEEGESQYLMWSQIFIIVDLLCCGAILFPVVWSIRHLKEASQTDGKVAINLQKLKLFRHFYILIVCYIYFTRIIIYLLRIAVPFQYTWMDDMFRELATLLFYVVTGYKFRPASDNPYLQVPQDSDDETEMDEVLTQSGATEGLSKVNVKVMSGDGADTSCGVSKRESSHDYD